MKTNNSIYQVYRNLHNKKLSIRNKRTKRVAGWCSYVLLSDVTFNVSETGRQKVLKDKQKNVHATIDGKVCDVVDFGYKNETLYSCLDYEDQKGFIEEVGQQFTYDPYKYSSFVRESDERFIKLNWDWCAIYADGTILVLDD